MLLLISFYCLSFRGSTLIPEGCLDSTMPELVIDGQDGERSFRLDIEKIEEGTQKEFCLKVINKTDSSINLEFTGFSQDYVVELANIKPAEVKTLEGNGGEQVYTITLNPMKSGDYNFYNEERGWDFTIHITANEINKGKVLFKLKYETPNISSNSASGGVVISKLHWFGKTIATYTTPAVALISLALAFIAVVFKRYSDEEAKLARKLIYNYVHGEKNISTIDRARFHNDMSKTIKIMTSMSHAYQYLKKQQNWRDEDVEIKRIQDFFEKDDNQILDDLTDIIDDLAKCLLQNLHEHQRIDKEEILQQAKDALKESELFREQVQDAVGPGEPLDKIKAMHGNLRQMRDNLFSYKRERLEDTIADNQTLVQRFKDALSNEKKTQQEISDFIRRLCDIFPSLSGQSIHGLKTPLLDAVRQEAEKPRTERQQALTAYKNLCESLQPLLRTVGVEVPDEVEMSRGRRDLCQDSVALLQGVELGLPDYIKTFETMVVQSEFELQQIQQRVEIDSDFFPLLKAVLVGEIRNGGLRALRKRLGQQGQRESLLHFLDRQGDSLRDLAIKDFVTVLVAPLFRDVFSDLFRLQHYAVISLGDVHMRDDMAREGIDVDRLNKVCQMVAGTLLLLFDIKPDQVKLFEEPFHEDKYEQAKHPTLMRMTRLHGKYRKLKERLEPRTIYDIDRVGYRSDRLSLEVKSSVLIIT